MKTIQFTGAEDKIENLHLALGISDNDMPQQSETRVYIIDTSYAIPISDVTFQALAEERGTVYTLEGFQKAFNEESINPNHYIRFITVPIYE
jgi:hypothetical protein